MKATPVVQQVKKRTATIQPSFCCFGIVDECMFKCRMCYKWQADRHVQERRSVSFDVWKNTITSLKTIVAKPDEFVINFGGGEALMRDDVLDLVRYATDEGFITNIASNGWLIDEACAYRIAQSGLKTINLSLDSIRPDIHDALRGKPGATTRVFQAINNLRKYTSELEIGICAVLYDANIDEILPLIKWVQHNEKLNWIVFMAAMQPNNTSPNNKWYEEEFRYLWPQNSRKVRWLINYIKWLKWWGWKIQNPYYQLDAFKKYFTNPQRFVKNSSCNMDRAVHISSTGDIFLCFRWDELGNINDVDIARVWNSIQAKGVRNKIKQCKDNCHFLINCFFERDYPFNFIKKTKQRI